MYTNGLYICHPRMVGPNSRGILLAIGRVFYLVPVYCSLCVPMFASYLRYKYLFCSWLFWLICRSVCCASHWLQTLKHTNSAPLRQSWCQCSWSVVILFIPLITKPLQRPDSKTPCSAFLTPQKMMVSDSFWFLQLWPFTSYKYL